jgi:hypothetical protein
MPTEIVPAIIAAIAVVVTWLVQRDQKARERARGRGDDLGAGAHPRIVGARNESGAAAKSKEGKEVGVARPALTRCALTMISLSLFKCCPNVLVVD